jgi:hypothetical protein
MVCDLELFGQLSDGDLVATWKSADGEQGLMLAWGQACGSGKGLAPVEEPTEMITEASQRLIIGFA